MERNIPVCGPDGKDKEKDVSNRDLLRSCERRGEMEETICTELNEKLPPEQPMAPGQQRRWQSGALQFLSLMSLQLATHMAHHGGWRQT